MSHVRLERVEQIKTLMQDARVLATIDATRDDTYYNPFTGHCTALHLACSDFYVINNRRRRHALRCLSRDGGPAAQTTAVRVRSSISSGRRRRGGGRRRDEGKRRQLYDQKQVHDQEERSKPRKRHNKNRSIISSMLERRGRERGTSGLKVEQQQHGLTSKIRAYERQHSKAISGHTLFLYSFIFSFSLS